MTIPYYLFLVVYGVALVVCIFFFLVNLYHLRRFGFLDFTAQLHTVMVAGVFFIAVIFSLIFLRHVPWLDGIDILPDFSVNLNNNE